MAEQELLYNPGRRHAASSLGLDQRRKPSGAQMLLLCAGGRLLCLPMVWVQGLLDVWTMCREERWSHLVVAVIPWEIPCELLGPGRCAGGGPRVSRILSSCPFQSVVTVWGRGKGAQCPAVNRKGLPWLVSLTVGWLQDMVAPPELPKVFQGLFNGFIYGSATLLPGQLRVL